jgi:hypothetical protein
MFQKSKMYFINFLIEDLYCTTELGKMEVSPPHTGKHFIITEFFFFAGNMSLYLERRLCSSNQCQAPTMDVQWFHSQWILFDWFYA